MDTIFSERVEFLLDTIGPRLTAVGAGFTDARKLIPLRHGEPVSDVVAARLNLLADVTSALMGTRYTGATAASFIRSQNDDLDEGSILMAIAESATVQDVEATRARLGIIVSGLNHPAMG